MTGQNGQPQTQRQHNHHHHQQPHLKISSPLAQQSTSPNSSSNSNTNAATPSQQVSRSPFLFHRTTTNIIISSPVANLNSLTNSEYAGEVVELIKNEEESRWIQGLIAIFITIVTWVIATQLTNGAIKNEGYNQPMLAAYINGSCFIVYGIPHYYRSFKDYISKIFKSNANGTHESTPIDNNGMNYGSTKTTDGMNKINDNDHNNAEQGGFSLENNASPENNFTSLARSIGSLTSYDYEANQLEDIAMTDSKIFQTPVVRLTFREMRIVALQTCIVYFGNSLCGTLSLRYTSSANQTIIFTTTSLFTLILGYLNKVEKFTIAKVIAVVVSISGIICITISDKQEDPNLPGLFSVGKYVISIQGPMIGDLIALCGAFLYACYLVILKLKLGSETDPQNDKIVFSYIGLFTLILGIPVLLVAHFTGFERFATPESNTIYLIIFASGLLNCISDYFSIIATLLTSPFITALSLTAAIPISMICDSIFYHLSNSSVLYYLGIIFIFSSFVFTNLTGEQEVIKEAVEEAIEEALEHNELLSPLLSPYLGATTGVRSPLVQSGSHFSLPEHYIPQLDQVGTPASNASTQTQIVVTGGPNHKYFIRELNKL